MKPNQPSTDSQNPGKGTKPGMFPRDKDAHPRKTDGDHARKTGADGKELEREDDQSKPIAAHNQENRQESGAREAGEKNRPKNPRENH